MTFQIYRNLLSVQTCTASLLLGLFGLAGLAHAAEAVIAVAANFAVPAQRLATVFAQGSTHSARISVGSTGTLYTQIINGAPIDLFLAADQQRPARLEQNGFAVAGSRFTYARGRLVYVASAARPLPAAFADADSGSPQHESDQNIELLAAALGSEHIRRIAIANPKLAPYGLAAQQTLLKLGLARKPPLVMGENVGQTLALIATGNVVTGFVALAQLRADAESSAYLRPQYWLVPGSLHAPIAQDGVLLPRAAANPAALEFTTFLRSEQARQLIERFGFLVAS